MVTVGELAPHLGALLPVEGPEQAPTASFAIEGGNLYALYSDLLPVLRRKALAWVADGCPPDREPPRAAAFVAAAYRARAEERDRFVGMAAISAEADRSIG